VFDDVLGIGLQSGPRGEVLLALDRERTVAVSEYNRVGNVLGSGEGVRSDQIRRG
jgi:hypothetical protein